MTTLTASAPRKLPIWQMVGASYAIVARNLGQLVRISWLWLLIMIPVYAVTHWLALQDWKVAGGQTMSGLVSEMAGFLPFVAELPFLASIAVAWHRLILHHERVTQPAYLRLDRTVWLYALYSFVFFVLIKKAPLTALLVLPPDVGVASMFLSRLVILILTLGIALFVLPWFSLVLPAIALGERLSFGQAWRITRGNRLRLALATCLCVVPASLLVILLAILPLLWFRSVPKVSLESLDQLYQLLGSPWFLVPTSLAYASLIIFAVTLLSLTYRFFAVLRDESQTERIEEANRP